MSNGDVMVGNYKIVREIAEGGFGTTYEGVHAICGGRACVKHCLKVSKEHNDVLIREAMALWDVAHFSLPAMRDIIETDDGSLALVMTYIEGLTIEQVVRKVGRLDAEKAVTWIVDRILNAMLYLHHNGVIHGDLKPQNVMLQHQKHYAFLIDFGLANARPTATTRVGGFTEHFSSPEQVASALERVKRPLLPAADLYSLGMLMLYMLGGGMEAVRRVQVPDSVPDPMKRFIKSLIARDPLERPQGNVFDVFRQVRLDSFGHVRSNMEPIPGL
jgi:serine/threonine protein kinase